MSTTRLPRELGIVLRCDEPRCLVKLQTANILLKVNRAAAASAGWIRGLRPKSKDGSGGKRRDLCPSHAPDERAKAAELKTRADAKRAARTAKAKARQAAGVSP